MCDVQSHMADMCAMQVLPAFISSADKPLDEAPSWQGLFTDLLPNVDSKRIFRGN